MERIYFDNAATTPVAPEVLEAMLPYFTESFGNASSIHTFGLNAKRALDRARQTLAQALHAQPSEIIFTSGGTEANNLAIFGVAAQHAEPQHMITSAIEHPSVLQACKMLEKKGWHVSYLPVDQHGVLDPDDLQPALRENTVLISVMLVNNETGVVQPVQQMAEIAAARGIPFHSDAVQAFGKMPIDLQRSDISLLSLSGHKIYGPKGVGALFVRKNVKLAPQLIGGGQEEKRRAGTENIPAIVGLAKAVELIANGKTELQNHLRQLSSRFIDFVQAHIDGAVLNGSREHLIPGIVNLSFPGLDSLALIMGLDLKGIAVSNGSACSSGSLEPSHVLRAMKISKQRQQSALRISFSRFNTVEQLEALQAALFELTKGKIKRTRREVA